MGSSVTCNFATYMYLSDKWTSQSINSFSRAAKDAHVWAIASNVIKKLRMTIISPMLILSIITNNVCQPHKRADGQETYQNEIGTIIDAQNSSKHIMYLFVKCRRSGNISINYEIFTNIGAEHSSERIVYLFVNIYKFKFILQRWRYDN